MNLCTNIQTNTMLKIFDVQALKSKQLHGQFQKLGKLFATFL